MSETDRKAVAVEVIVELHAAHIYQFQASSPGCMEAFDGLLLVERVNGIALQVKRVGVKISVDAGFG